MRNHFPRMQRVHKIVLLSLAVLLPVFIFVAIKVVNSLDYFNQDFFTFWLAGHMTWIHQSPYAPEQWLASHDLFGLWYIPNPIFPYPLPLALLFAPLGLLPYKEAFITGKVLSEIAIFVSVYLLSGSTFKDKKGIHLLLPVFASVVLFRATILTLLNGQLGGFLLLAFCLTIGFWQKGKGWQGAVVLSFVFLKPTIGFPVVLIAMGCLWMQKNRRTILFILGSGLAWLTIGWIQNPNWVFLFLSNGNRKLSETIGHAPNLWGMSGAVCHLDLPCITGLGSLLVFILLIATGYVLFSKRDLSPSALFSLAIPAALMLTPYIWAYDHILLLIPISFVTTRIFNRGYPYLVPAVFPIAMSILSIGFLILANGIAQDVWSAGMPLICFILVAWQLFLPSKMPEQLSVKESTLPQIQ
jgi:hypothetical protein